jgi:myo-inositol-1(or 4)-monophosphatase
MPTPPRPALRDSTLRALLRSARSAAEAVGGLVAGRHRDGPRSDVRAKARGDFVTAVDLAGERVLRRELLRAHPDHGFLGEEGGGIDLDADFVWIVDPIDGTSNFAQGLRTFAVSVACVHRGWPVAAAAHCWPERATYSAALGLGAWRGRRRIRTPAARLDPAAVVGVQWFRGAWEPELLEPLCRSGARIRTFGSTVTQLCDVAVGRLHANVQTQGRIWDLAAAALIAAEAGAAVTDWSGRPLLPFADLGAPRHYPSLSAPAPLHAALRRALRPAVAVLVVPPA